MKELVGQCLLLYKRESHGKYNNYISGFLIFAAFFIGMDMPEKGIILLLAGTTLISCRVNTLHFQFHTSDLAYLSKLPIMKIKLCGLYSSMLGGLALYVSLFVYMNVYYPFSPLFQILFSLLLYVYCILIGIFTATTTRDSKKGTIVILALFLSFYLASYQVHELVFRYSSPILQLYNYGDLYFVNVAGIILLCIILLFVYLMRGRTAKLAFGAVCCILAFAAILLCEKNEDAQLRRLPYKTIMLGERILMYRGIDAEDAIELGRTIYSVQDKFIEYGLMREAYPVMINRSIYFPWKSKQELYPVRIDIKGRFVLNCCFNTMVNMNRSELIIWTSDELFEPVNRIQREIIKIFNHRISSEISEENKYNIFTKREQNRISSSYRKIIRNDYKGILERYQNLPKVSYTFCVEVVVNYLEALPAVIRLASLQGENNEWGWFISNMEKVGIWNENQVMQEIINLILLQEN